MSDAGASTPTPGSSGAATARQKRVRGAVDLNNIVDGERTRRRTSNALDVSLRSPGLVGCFWACFAQGGQGRPIPPMYPQRIQKEGPARVCSPFPVPLEGDLPKLTVFSCDSARCSSSRPLYYAFAELPSPQDYPDYYRMIKKPISYAEIKEKLDQMGYTCLSEVRNDFNQMYVNAKRYNAPGSPLFLDAKRQHKLLKDTYAVMTGEDKDDEETGRAGSVGPNSDPTYGEGSSRRSGRKREDGGGGGGGGGDKQKGIAMKTWLLKKLDETMAPVDMNGRPYADNFMTLPDRDAWPHYYQVIPRPVSFEVVRSRLNKRSYHGVQHFVDDVNMIFSNAMFYNEEGSRIWKDALFLQQHFAEVMSEQPPSFTLLRKRQVDQDIPTTTPQPPQPPARRRRQSSAIPTTTMSPEAGNEQAYEPDEDEEMDDDESRQGSVAPVGIVDPLRPKVEDIPLADPYALPGIPVNALSAPAYPPQASPTLPTGLPALPSFDATANSLMGLASSSSGIFGAHDVAMASPASYGANGHPSPAASNGTLAPVSRLVARAPLAGEVPLVSRFEVTLVTSSPSKQSIRKTVILDNSSVRQHSLSVPFSTERVELAPVFRRSPGAPASPTSKGKGKAVENGLGLDANGYEPTPQVTVTARPSGATISPVADLPPAPGAGDLSVHSPASSATRYALVPRKGLNVVEVVARPAVAIAGEEGGEEVYRLFVTK
ncbi:Methionine aminopeptidase [Rhodotorula toruloides ATCC 204091]|uniref:BY PROTMAP: gi/342321581/gb/EGU13514.1/ Methionine aminopeptidase [Rhodotorula glutinis ATCC 204091] n=1 Tax=Rhodotorula toruloides TaxID=5286 RepID=A0A0K3CHN0_RHOTO|nr:Methionine aminopeptidase [Rhodotorula toruloides ATCC 204091]